MKIIVGLGNPGKKFENTRHNAGFVAAGALAKGLKFSLNKKFNAEILSLMLQNDKELILVKPQTFMNDSGEAVKKVLQYYNKTTKTLQHYNNLYVLHDDLDIPLGEYKIQFGRGSAGHNGVESIIKELGTKDFWRIRIGIAKPKEEKEQCLLSGKDYVLQKFEKEEKKVLDKVIKKVINKMSNLKCQK